MRKIKLLTAVEYGSNVFYSMLVTLEPALGSVDFSILASDAVDRVIGHTENGSFSKVLAHHCQATLLNLTKKAERKGGTNAESLVDAGIEIRQTFDLSNGCDQLVFRSQLFIESFFQDV